MSNIKREYLTSFDVSYENYEQFLDDLTDIKICKESHKIPDGDCAMCNEVCCSQSYVNNV